MFIRNCWYAAGWSTDFPSEGLRAIDLLDEPLVLYRQSSGRLIALEDRCCHRLAPLSKGRVEGDDLRCMYHGLKFNGSGVCIEIPGQPQIPPQTCVRAFPVVERHSIAWIWMGEPTEADDALIPPFRGVNDPEFDMLPGRMDYDANYMLINDNLLDLSHLSFVHRDSFGAGDDFSTKRPTITRLERGLRVARWVEQRTPKYLAPKFPDVEHVDTWISYDFLVPGVFLMDAKFYPKGAASVANHGEPAGEPLYAEYTCQAVTPLRERKSCYFFAYGPWSRVEGLAEYYREVSYLAFKEDKVMIEAQQKVIDASPGVSMKPTSFDAAPSQFRWMVEKMIAQERNSSTRSVTS